MEITLNLSEKVYRNLSKLAERKNRRVEDVITDKLQSEMFDYEETLSGWTDEAVLALANLQLPKEQANRMNELSELRQQNAASPVEDSEFEMYLEIYNNANLRKAYGIAEAVRRGLINSTSDLK